MNYEEEKAKDLEDAKKHIGEKHVTLHEVVDCRHDVDISVNPATVLEIKDAVYAIDDYREECLMYVLTDGTNEIYIYESDVTWDHVGKFELLADTDFSTASEYCDKVFKEVKMKKKQEEYNDCAEIPILGFVVVGFAIIFIIGSLLYGISLTELINSKALLLFGLLGIAEFILLAISLVIQLCFHNDMKKQKETFLSYVADKNAPLFAEKKTISVVAKQNPVVEYNEFSKYYDIYNKVSEK